jgi:hypothetical protein
MGGDGVIRRPEPGQFLACDSHVSLAYEPVLSKNGQEGLPTPQEPAWLTSAGMDAGAQAASRERSPGWAQRTSGDGARAAPTSDTREAHVRDVSLPAMRTLESA